MCLAGAAGADDNYWAQRGEKHMADGRYAAAAKALENITGGYEHRSAVNFNLAWCYYLTGAHEQAIPLFAQLAREADAAEVQQQSQFLLAECQARLAEQQDAASPAGKRNLAQAIEQQTRFQTAYPQSLYLPYSLSGRAYAYYLDGQMAKAEADLLTLMKNFPDHSAARDGQYLLASVYSRQALELLQAGKPAAARPLLDKAGKIFSQLAQLKGNLARANDSAFALGEIWFNAGYFAPALRYFREVRAKQDVLDDLRARISALDAQRAAEIGQGLNAAPTRAESDRLKAQLGAVSAAPDLELASCLRIAECFFQQRRYAETRLVCQHVLPFLPEAQKPEIGFLIVNAYIEEKNAAGAARALDDFRRTFGAGQPLAEMAGLAIGQLFLRANNPQDALTQLANNAEDYPQGKGLEEGLFMKFSAEFMLNRYDEVNETAELYLEKFPKGKYLPNALYLQALSLAGLKQWDEALAAISTLLKHFPKPTDTFTAADEAAYQQGWFLYQKALALKPDAAPEKERKKIAEQKQAVLAEAAKQFDHFLGAYKDSKLRPIAMYQMALVLNAADQVDKAKAALQALAKQYPEHSIAPTALYQVGVMYYEREDFPHMGEAMEALVQAYPSAAIVPEAHFWIGFIAKKAARFDQAAEAFNHSIGLAPNGPLAAECLFLAAQSYREKADAMGMPVMLSEERKGVFRDAVLESARAYEGLLANYPSSARAEESIPSIAKNLQDLVMNRLLKEDEAVAWFEKAKTRHAAAPEAKAQLTFSLASYFLKNKEKDKAMAAFKEAFAINPNARLSPVMLADYAEALKDADKLQEAEGIYNKIIKEYASDPRAVAPAWFGIADIKYRQKDFAAAKQAFETVLKQFPWYEPGKQGKNKLAKILEDNRQYDEAEKMYTQVWKQEKQGEARIAAMLGVARCQLARANGFRQQGNIASMNTMFKAASEIVLKIINLYEAFPDYVSEAWLIQGQLYELKENPVQARATYDRLVKEYKNYPAAKPAAERLQKFGGPLPPAAGQK